MREKSWEYVGKTMDEAVQTALEELGLERDDIHVEVVEEPQKGFLGMGGKEARIRVELIGEWEVMGAAHKARQEEEELPLEGEEDLEEDLGRPVESTSKPLRMVKEIIGIIGIDAMVEAREREDSVVIDVWGEDVAVLIGKSGTTLDATQYLLNVCCRSRGGSDKRIILDIEGYRKRRKARLEKHAEQMAKKVTSSGKSVELEPMSAAERKTIHMALRDIGGVRTESTGEDRERRVVIHPDS